MTNYSEDDSFLIHACANGDVARVKVVWAQCRGTDMTWGNALAAAARGRAEIVQFLLPLSNS